MAEQTQQQDSFPVIDTHYDGTLEEQHQQIDNKSPSTAFKNIQKGLNERRQSIGASLSPIAPDHCMENSIETLTDAKMFDYRGKKIAGFEVKGVEMLCLPQAYETFLKDVIGGLHTVYTKLKRLQIQPVVCTVEQVRILRGLGAIQQGVNRCKLISRDDFNRLYNDCYRIYPRLGRPIKRSIKTDWENVSSDKNRKRDFSAATSQLSRTNDNSEWIYRQSSESSLPSNNNNDNITAPIYNCLQQYPLLISRIVVGSNGGVNGDQVQVYRIPYAAQNLIAQQMLAAAAAAAASSQQILSQNDKTIDTVANFGQESRESCDSSSSSNISKSASPVPVPLNLTKNGSNNPSESDSVASFEANSNSSSDKTLSSDHSNQNILVEDEPTAQFIINKLVNLIQMATINFKTEHEVIENEKSFALNLQDELKLKRIEFEKIQRELSREQKKAKIYFRRYCKARMELLELKEKFLDLSNNTNTNIAQQQQ